MGRPRAFDEVATLDAIKDTCWELGYEAASIDDHTKRTGLSRSSLYATYGSKDELFTRALERYPEQQSQLRLHGLETGADGVEAIRRYFADICETAEASGERFGCFAANFDVFGDPGQQVFANPASGSFFALGTSVVTCSGAQRAN